MFVYKFMSGIVDLREGAEDEEGEAEQREADYDPHAHRIIEHPTSYSETMTHLLKGSIGAGILAMSDATKRMGVLYTIIGLVAIGIFATYSIQLLINTQYRLCKRWKCGYMAYPKSMRLSIRDGPPSLRWAGPIVYYFVDLTLILWQLGICCIYFVFVAENIKQVCDFYGQVMGLRVHLLYLLIPTIIVNLVKDLKLMTPLSSISNVVTLFGLILVFYYLLEDDIVITKEMIEMKHVEDIPVFVGIALFALEAVGVVLALEYNMEEPKKFVGLFGLFNVGMVIILGLYLIVGVFGYLKYGDEVKASITLNLPHHEKKAQAAKIIFALSIFLSFPLQNFVAYNIVWRRLKKKVDGNRMYDYILRVVLVLIPWFLAVAIPKLGPFISLFGALCLSLLAMVFPGLMDLCVCYSELNKYGPGNYKLFRDIFILIIGSFILVSGVYTSIRDIITGGGAH